MQLAVSKDQTSTRNKILELAQEAMASRGYAAFSFRELAFELGIKSASVHYHFPTKVHLGLAVAQSYREKLAADLADIVAKSSDPRETIDKYVALFRQEASSSQRMTFCTMLSADIHQLPPEICAEMRAFYELNLHWLAARFANLGLDESLQQERACQTFALLQGALTGAKGQNSLVYFDLAMGAMKYW
jgi:TetR/AcrR family transcriptional regulator, transcriptional repressor for nem operon